MWMDGTAGERLRRLELVLEGSHHGYWDLEVGQHHVTVSRRLREILDLPGEGPESAIPLDDFYRSVHPDDLVVVRAEVDELMAGRRDHHLRDYRLVWADGRCRWVRTRARAVARDPDGRPLRIAGTLTDVTEEKLHAEEMARQAALHVALLRNYPGGAIAMLDASLRVQVITGTRALLGAAMDQAAGRHPRDFLSPDVAAQIEAAALTALEGSESRFELHLERSIVEVVAGPIRDEDGVVRRCIIVSHDVTERRELEAQIAVASHRAALETLITGVAHEVNNPLAGIRAAEEFTSQELRGIHEVLKDGEGRDRSIAERIREVLEALADMRLGTDRITKIVKALQAISRTDPRRDRIHLADVVQAAVAEERSAPNAEAAWRDIAVRLEDAGAPAILGAAGQLKTVLRHLLSNAAKAIPDGRAGEVVVRVLTGDKGTAIVEVSDNGRGIDPSAFPQIFDPFFTAKKIGRGTGLGLAICHAIVTAHWGAFTARSRVGRGSTFTIEFPAAPPAPAEVDVAVAQRT